jgi:hypothetical protein
MHATANGFTPLAHVVAKLQVRPNAGFVCMIQV